MTRKPAHDESLNTGTDITASLLADLRDIMASSLHAEDKLQDICKLTANHLSADVCSVYLIRSNDELELFATVGLKKESINKTRLKMGEGIVGYAAQHGAPLNIANAADSPHFAARPETGENEFSSFCAVPILREQKTRGALAIQSKNPQVFPDETVALLQTIAMVLAEFVASGDIISRTELALISKPIKKPTQMQGQSFSPGLVISTAVIHKARPTVKNVIAEDVEVEKKRLEKAIAGMDTAIGKMIDKADVQINPVIQEMLESYRLFARDKNWRQKIVDMIDQGLTADAAVQRAQSEIRGRFQGMDAPVLQDKAYDVDDISNRLLTTLNQVAGKKDDRPSKFILVARSLSPAALFDYGLEKIKAIVLTGGSKSGHIAIIARSLNIPVLGQCRDAARYIRDGDKLIVDTDNHVVYLNPSEYVQDLYKARLDTQRRKHRRYKKTREKPAVTKDGVRINVQINAALSAEMPLLEESGADGIGLFRTEISFMGRSRYPRVADQAEFYSAILDQAGDKPVTFRTLDIGGDKPLPYFKSPDEENPALGWRAMRIIMDRPAVLRTQARALIRGANGRPLRMMLPFVSDIHELQQAKKLIQMEFDRAKNVGLALPEKFELGVMIEVPSLLWQLDEVFKLVDFAGVGTNDLKQYLFATDYRSDVLKDRYDVLSLSMLRALKNIADKAKEHKTPVSICGEMASIPVEAMTLVALGYENLSMPISALGDVKETIRSMDASKTKTYVDFLLRTGAQSIRKKLISFARDHKIKI